MNRLFLFLIFICVIQTSYPQDLCPGVNVLKRKPSTVISKNENMILYRISRVSDVINSDFSVCSLDYVKEGKCKGVLAHSTDSYINSCFANRNGLIVQLHLARFIFEIWGEDTDGNLLFIQQELESIDNFREIYKTKRIAVRKANKNNLVAVNLSNPSDIVTFYQNNIIATVARGRYFRIYQLCNRSKPLIIVLITQNSVDAVNEVKIYFKNNNLNENDFITLTGSIDVNPAVVRNVPAMKLDQTPAKC